MFPVHYILRRRTQITIPAIKVASGRRIILTNPIARISVAERSSLLGLSSFGIVSSSVFLVLVLIATLQFKKRSVEYRRSALDTPADRLPPVTILKPVHGMEARLEENLESFFWQDYPDFEIMIGARNADDPALAVAEKLRHRYPKVKSRIVISGPPPS